MKIRLFALIAVLVFLITVSGCQSEGTSETVIQEEASPAVEETEAPVSEETEPVVIDEEETVQAGDSEEVSQIQEDDAFKPSGAVLIEKKGSYYDVTIDYSSGLSYYDLGAEYGYLLTEQVPGIQSALDTFVYKLIDVNMDMYIEDLELGIPDALKSMATGFVTDMLYQRIPDVIPQVPAEYMDELDGLASTLCDTTSDNLGDGKLSKNELYFTHLMGDIARTVQCSATGVEKSASSTGEVLAARGFDLDAGMEGYGSITTLQYENRTTYLIGWLGNLTAFTGFNDTGLFGAVVDTTGSGEPYTSSGIYSYSYDLRTALEQANDIDAAASYLDTNPYGFNHMMFLADPDKTGILENNISGTGDNMRREIRYGDSPLMPEIEWPYDDIVIGVSAFMLEGNHDNFTESVIATSRFDNYLMLLEDMMTDDSLDWEELKTIHSYDGTDGVPGLMEYGDIYNVGTRYIVLFEPATLRLEVCFIQTEVPPDDPEPFEVISIP